MTVAVIGGSMRRHVDEDATNEMRQMDRQGGTR